MKKRVIREETFALNRDGDRNFLAFRDSILPGERVEIENASGIKFTPERIVALRTPEDMILLDVVVGNRCQFLSSGGILLSAFVPCPKCFDVPTVDFMGAHGGKLVVILQAGKKGGDVEITVWGKATRERLFANRC